MEILINGEPTELISVRDRGLQYGDGCFETIRLHRKIPLLLPLHLDRLKNTCRALNISVDFEVLLRELHLLLAECPASGVIKILITRGAGDRGYRPNDQANAVRIIQYFSMPSGNEAKTEQGIVVTVCQHRLSENRITAGLKHLNRLDQVLASRELSSIFDEGLCQDQGGNLIEATRSNVLLVANGVLISPKLDKAGVEGIMLSYLQQRFSESGKAVHRREVSLTELTHASELFLCNSVFGVWPVIKMVENDTVLHWSVGPLARQAIQFHNEVLNTPN